MNDSDIRKEAIKCYKRALEHNSYIQSRTMNMKELHKHKSKYYKCARSQKAIQDYNYNKSRFLFNLADAIKKENENDETK